MKTFLTFLILLFSSSVFADDISDFEIEGISIGDSALEYISLEEIQKEIEKSKIRYAHKKNSYKFGEVELENKKLQTYDGVSFFVKSDLVNKYLSNKNEKILHFYMFLIYFFA